MNRTTDARALRNAVRTVLIGAMTAGVVGCGGDGGQNLLGTGKRAPDEFAVYSRAPLTLPPDYGLRPPAPASGPTPIAEPREDARNAMLGGRSDSAGGAYASAAPTFGSASAGAFSYAAPASATAPRPPPTSPGVDVMLARTGASNADPAIRTLINKETDILAEEDQSLVERMMWWGTTPDYGTVVDPVEERRRITENQALGRTITSGQTPTIERKKRALLEGIFD